MVRDTVPKQSPAKPFDMIFQCLIGCKNFGHGGFQSNGFVHSFNFLTERLGVAGRENASELLPRLIECVPAVDDGLVATTVFGKLNGGEQMAAGDEEKIAHGELTRGGGGKNRGVGTCGYSPADRQGHQHRQEEQGEDDGGSVLRMFRRTGLFDELHEPFDARSA